MNRYKSIHNKCVSAGDNDKVLQERAFVHNREYKKLSVHGSDIC